MEATLRVRPLDPALAQGKRIVVACPHGRTEAIVLGDDTTGQLPLRVAVAKHYAEEGCTCTRSLRRRLGMAEKVVRA
jgi:hypothetical protein